MPGAGRRSNARPAAYRNTGLAGRAVAPSKYLGHRLSARYATQSPGNAADDKNHPELDTELDIARGQLLRLPAITNKPRARNLARGYGRRQRSSAGSHN